MNEWCSRAAAVNSGTFLDAHVATETSHDRGWGALVFWTELGDRRTGGHAAMNRFVVKQATVEYNGRDYLGRVGPRTGCSEVDLKSPTYLSFYQF